MNPDPCDFHPTTPQEFIGESRRIALMLEAKAKALLERKNPAPVKILLYGAPGTGKTRLVEMFANLLAWHPTAIENTNGRNLTIDVVRRWQESSCYIPLGGRFVIKTVQELDTATPQAQDLLLSFLDDAKPYTVFLGTSNLMLMQLTERFETRMQQFKVTPPTTEEIAALLVKRWGFKKQRAMEIAVGSGNNVRAALLDAQSVLDVSRIAA